MATTTVTLEPTVIVKAPPTPAVKIVLGAMNIGKQGRPKVKIHDLADCTAMLDVLQKHGYNEVDVARVYGGGSSEEVLGQLKWADRGLSVGTKVLPGGQGPGANKYSHSKDGLKLSLEESLQALGTESLDLLYLHVPDHNTPYVETLEAVDELFKAGYLKRFGICNFSAWEVAQICELCEANGWKKPDVYQGIYHALHRSVEAELFPCLRHYGISFYSFTPLAGGFLTDKFQRETTQPQGSHSVPKDTRNQYTNETYLAALDLIRPVAQKYGIPTAEAALRWSRYHSQLKGQFGDAIVIGSSSPQQLEDNLTSFEHGPLPEELVKAWDDAWQIARAVAGPYFR